MCSSDLKMLLLGCQYKLQAVISLSTTVTSHQNKYSKKKPTDQKTNSVNLTKAFSISMSFAYLWFLFCSVVFWGINELYQVFYFVLKKNHTTTLIFLMQIDLGKFCELQNISFWVLEMLQPNLLWNSPTILN